MNNIIKKIVNNKLIKLSFFNSISIVIKIITSIVSTKALAYFIGPSGLAFVGIFKEFFNMIINVSSLGLQRGIIKYSSELKTNSKELNVFISTAMIIGVSVSILIALFLFVFSNSINSYLFPNHNYNIIFKILALIIPTSVIANFYISFLNGLGYVNHIVRINILLYILSTIAIVVLSYYYNTFGALLGISFFYMLQLISIFFFRPKRVSFVLLNINEFSKKYLKKLLGFTLMTIFSLLLFPFISILIRGEIVNLFGEDAAGYWEAMKRISENYLLFASSLVLLSVLPKLSEENAVLKKVVTDFYKSIVPLFMVGLFIVFIFKDFIVVLFYSKEFLPTTVLFKWYAIGDLFRVLGIVLTANFYARRDIKGYIITDMFLACIMYFLTIFLLRTNGLEGGALAYFVSYLLYFVLLLLVFRKELFFPKINI